MTSADKFTQEEVSVSDLQTEQQSQCTIKPNTSILAQLCLVGKGQIIR